MYASWSTSRPENRREPDITKQIDREMRIWVQMIRYESQPRPDERSATVIKFFLWCILFVLCWPLALLALVLYPIVWLLLLPFRLVGIAVEGVFELIRAVLFLPARILRGPRTA